MGYRWSSGLLVSSSPSKVHHTPLKLGQTHFEPSRNQMIFFVQSTLLWKIQNFQLSNWPIKCNGWECNKDEIPFNYIRKDPPVLTILTGHILFWWSSTFAYRPLRTWSTKSSEHHPENQSGWNSKFVKLQFFKNRKYFEWKRVRKPHSVA